jgi:glycosyltransferase involved in cell wall biosynthesis
MRMLFLVRRAGPYHDARFEAAGRSLELTVAETRPETQEYPWTTAASARGYRLTQLGRPARADRGLRGPELAAAIERCFESSRPEVVACTGWADPEYHAALVRCHARRIPAIVMSDSTYEDEPRQWWRERLKRPVIRAFAAAVVAGSRSRAYLRRFGFPEEAIFEPWDVVDNGHFFRVAATAPSGPAARPYFLCISRYLPKKNLVRLVEAYAAYRGLHGPAAWNLVVLGSGEMAEDLNRAVSATGTGAFVHRPGFVQYDELPAYYGSAGAAVLPSLSDQWGLAVNEAMAAGLPVIVSTACGCAPDLVAEGENGFTFDPADTGALAQAMLRVAALPDEERRRMGAAGRLRIGRYSLELFSAALLAAAQFARAGRRSPGLGTRLLLNAALRG